MKRLLLALLSAVSLTAAAQPASAETQPALAFITSTGVTIAIVAVGGVMTTAAVLVSAPGRKQRVSRYMRENEAAVRHAFALGGGDAITEIAAILGVPDGQHAEFAAALRADRKSLLPAAYAQADVRPILQLGERHGAPVRR